MNQFADTPFDVSGRTALVTRGTRGIGRAIAERLAQQAPNVVISGWKPGTLEDRASSINARSSARAIASVCNITREAQTECVIPEAENVPSRLVALTSSAHAYENAPTVVSRSGRKSATSLEQRE